MNTLLILEAAFTGTVYVLLCLAGSFTILFTQLSLPVSNIAIILSLTSVLDFIATAMNIFTGQCVLALASRGLEHKQSE